MSGSAPVVAVVLAAGKGTRMKSALPKVLHEAAGRPLLRWVLETARAAGCDRIVVVIGHGAEEVERARRARRPLVLQEPQLGTGHALAQAAPESTARRRCWCSPATCARARRDAACAARADRRERRCDGGRDLDAPGMLGRVMAREDGRARLDREARDATPEQAGRATINARHLRVVAPESSHGSTSRPRNAQGELYLTDAVTALVAKRRAASRSCASKTSRKRLGVNTRAEARAGHIVAPRAQVNELMLAGVTVLEPHRTRIDPDTTIGPIR